VSLPLRALVCDDEAIARKRAARLVGEIAGVELVGECASGDEVLARIQAEDVDVLLLDVHMPGMTGLEALAKMPEERPYVVFVTAHPEHALDAWNVGAVDYILKPLDKERLAKALDRARNLLDRGADLAGGAPGPVAAGTQAAQGARLAVATRDGAVFVAIADVTHAAFDGSLVTIHTRERSVLSDHTLQDLEAKVPAASFVRVHRRALLNLDHVERLESVPSGGYVAHVAGGKTVDISRQAARQLRRRLGIR
jgi:two-component system LytT family response regulator